MSFSDEDLKRLKEIFECSPQIDVHGFTDENFKALLARLEAAERIVNRMCVHAGSWRGKLDGCFKDEVKAWRKAAGK